jgi:hypothetical protein
MMARVPPNLGSPWLLAGAALSTVASLLHLAVIVGGPDWYRFFGAGEDLARAAERGSWAPALITLAIASLLALWAAFALSGAGRLRRLPCLRTALVGISAVYLARGLLLIPVALYVPYPEGAFDYWSSLIVLVYGLVHAVGTWRAWPALRPPGAARA